jgi:hypothetical protein
MNDSNWPFAARAVEAVEAVEEAEACHHQQQLHLNSPSL